MYNSQFLRLSARQHLAEGIRYKYVYGTYTSEVSCLSLLQPLCSILNFVFQGIWLDDVMAWVEAHLEEKLASAGSNTKVQSAGWVGSERSVAKRWERPMKNVQSSRNVTKIIRMGLSIISGRTWE